MSGTPSWMSGGGRLALLDVREWSGDPPRFVGAVRRPSRTSGSGREALLDVREWSEGPLGSPRVVGSPSRMTGGGREALTDVREMLPDVQECREFLPVFWEWSEGSPR